MLLQTCVQNCLFVIYLTDPPEFSSFSSDVVFVEGDPSVTLECIADGVPTPNITWTKVYTNGSDSGVLGTENQFNLATNRNNSGTYRCTAYNCLTTVKNEIPVNDGNSSAGVWIRKDLKGET